MVTQPEVRMRTTKGTLIIRLYPEHAPKTVANFLKLVNKGFYNGLTFHRVIEDFVIQGGCPKGNGTGGPGWTIKCETKGNPLIHEFGALSMAHSGKDTGGSQFFIVLGRQQTTHLDGKHTVFGEVIQGLDYLPSVKQGDKMLQVSEIKSGGAPVSGKTKKSKKNQGISKSKGSSINRQALRQKLNQAKKPKK
jgi:peptidyl-prolyl cis-trans isomerase B (cyclophilin B)